MTRWQARGSRGVVLEQHGCLMVSAGIYIILSLVPTNGPALRGLFNFKLRTLLSCIATCTVWSFVCYFLLRSLRFRFFGTFAPRFVVRLPLDIKVYFLSCCSFVPRMRHRFITRCGVDLYPPFCFSNSRIFDLPFRYLGWQDPRPLIAV